MAMILVSSSIVKATEKNHSMAERTLDLADEGSSRGDAMARVMQLPTMRRRTAISQTTLSERMMVHFLSQ